MKGLCDVRGIVSPIAYGISFGGYVAQAYATGHPGHSAKLILASTAAYMDFEAVYDAFDRIDGPEVAAIARERWTHPTPETRAAYIARCVPLYRPAVLKPQPPRRTVVNEAVAVHFSGEERELMRMDFRPTLDRIQCPVLVMVGDKDSITPMAFSEEIVAYLPPRFARMERFGNCRHGTHVNDLREIILS